MQPQAGTQVGNATQTPADQIQQAIQIQLKEFYQQAESLEINLSYVRSQITRLEKANSGLCPEDCALPTTRPTKL